MRRLFIRSGGGLPGLDIHAGIWKALEEAGIESTENAGTSAGAIVSAFDSAGYSAARAAEIIHALDDSDVRSERFAWAARLFWLESFMVPEPILKLLERYLPDLFEALHKPLTVNATSSRTGASHLLTEGLLRPAVLASMSISGVFPPVNIPGHGELSDGGTSANLPLPAHWDEADEIWLLVATRPLKYQGAGILGKLLWNIDLLLEDQVADTIALVCRTVGHRAKVIHPILGRNAKSLHFAHTLIAEAHAQTRALLRGMKRLP